MTTNETKTLPILGENPYTDNIEAENYFMFRDQLAHWCVQWTYEVSEPIMRNCEELYDNQAVRVLVLKWFNADESYKSWRHRKMVDLSKYEGEEVPEVDLYGDERRAYSQALYALLVR